MERRTPSFGEPLAMVKEVLVKHGFELFIPNLFRNDVIQFPYL
jgi:hypothetical protein